MSDIMFDDPAYRPTFLRNFVIHTDAEIKGFFFEYRFLSNFEPCALPAGYPTVENAYMAAKVRAEHRSTFKTMTPREAKTTWRKYPMVDKSPADWDARKYEVMRDLLYQKFDPNMNPELATKLIDTGEKKLVEWNYWSDVFWGVDHKFGGQNNLGKILMEIRNELKK